MGMIGMAFGLGFILGPASAGQKARAGWRAGICASNFVLAFFILEGKPATRSERAASRPKLAQWRHTLAVPKLGLLIITVLLAT